MHYMINKEDVLILLCLVDMFSYEKKEGSIVFITRSFLNVGEHFG